ncbi:MAG: ATP-binding protein [Anaerolineales bacterium]
MDYSEKLRNADKMLLDGYTGQAIVAAGRVLEELLQHLCQSVLPKLKAKDQQTVSQKLEQIGKGKAVTDLTLGQLVGLFREAELFDKYEAAFGVKLARLRAADYTGLVDLRNRAAHAGGAVEEDEARLIVSQVRVFVREAGLLELPREEKKARAAASVLRPWSQVARLHPDVASGQTATATYAIDLGALVAGDQAVPKVYREAEAFFRATHPTSNMERLIEEVLNRLAGGPGDRVLQLRSPFGGGKSHVLAALYHATQNRAAMEAIWPKAKSWPHVGADLVSARPVRVAVFDGDKFDVQGREVAKGVRVQTLWGWIAWRLGGTALYERVRYHDERRVAPGGDVIRELLGRGQPDREASPREEPPTLIMLDEVLKYFERAQADTTVVGESTLGRQTLDFIQTLSTAVTHASHAVMIYSLQASAGEAFGNVALLNMLDHLTSRVDAKREPVVGDEILPVLQRRLLDEPPTSAVADEVAGAYSAVVTGMRAAQARTASEKRAVQDEALALRRRFQAAYPFHPALIDLMKERWASIPDFQRTRGALRFLSTCLHALKDGSGPLLGPGDVFISSGTVQHAFFTEVGQREQFKAVLEADFTGPNARARRIDERLAAEFPHLSGVHPATRLATAILMYSFGGLQRPGEGEGQAMATGVTEPELLAAVIGPDLDGLTAQTALKALREECLFLHYDGARYLFRTTPNITQLLEQEFDNNVKPEEAEKKIEAELQQRLAGRAALVWPKDSAKVDDLEPRFTLVYLPLDFASWGEARQREVALDLLLKRGDHPRRYRNGLGLALPNWHQIETLRRAARYALAVESLRAKRTRHNLTTEQMAQLKERDDTEKSKIESAFRDLYNAVWLPVAEAQASTIGLEKMEIGARPLSATGIHERLMELLTTVHRKVHGTLKAHKVLEHMRLGEPASTEGSRLLGVSTEKIRDAFFENLGFPRLLDESVVRRAIVEGVKDGYFGYAGRADRIEKDRVQEGSGYLLSRQQASIQVDIREDEIDLGAGFIVLPEAIAPETPQPATAPAAVAPTAGSEPTPPTQTPTPSQGAGPGSLSTRVELRLRLTRSQLYNSFNALANLAEKAGSVHLIVVAESLSGFDPVWLRNAVKEPLDEAGVEVEG